MDEPELAELRARLAAKSTPELLGLLAKHQHQPELQPYACAFAEAILRERGVAIDEAVASLVQDSPDPNAPVGMVVVAAVFNLTEAQLIRMRLEQAGLEVLLADENVARLHHGYGIAAGGIKVLVRPQDAELARTVLDDPPLHFELACPSCGSPDVSREDHLLRGATVAVGLFMATPEPQLTHTGRCRACAYSWED